MESNKDFQVFNMESFLRGLKIPQEQAEKLQSETAWRHSEPVSNVRNKIAGLAQAYAAAAVAAIASPQRQQQQGGQPGPSNPAPEAAQLAPLESIQASASPAPKSAVDAARDIVGAMADVLGGGQGSPSKSDEGAQEPRISPLGAQIHPVKQKEKPRSSAGRRKGEAAEIEAMPPPPPLPTQEQQQQQQQQEQQLLLPTQPQNISARTDGTASMDIDDTGPGNQGGHGGGQGTQPKSPFQSADIAQLPITQPIPYGGTSPEALNKVASVQGEATHTGEEAEEEEISPAKGAVAAFLAQRQRLHSEEQRQQEEEGEEEEEVCEPIISPSARGWFESIKNFGLSKLPKPKHTLHAGGGSGNGSGSRKAPTPVFGSSAPGGAGFGAIRRPLTEGLTGAGWNVNSQSLLPTQAAPQSTTNEDGADQHDNRDNLNTQETVIIDQDETGDDEQQQRQGTRAAENNEIDPRDQHLATSIDARLDAGGGAGGGLGGTGVGEGAASPMRPRPFHQPSSVEAIDIEEYDVDGGVEEGEVEEGTRRALGDAVGGVRTRDRLQSAAAIPAVAGAGIAQRAASSVAQNGANAAAVGAVAFSGGVKNNFSAFGIGLGGPLTQDFYGVTATQEDIEAILGNGGLNGAGTVEDAGNGVAAASQGRERSALPAEPSRGPGNAILNGRDISKNAARTTTGNVRSKVEGKEVDGVEEEEEEEEQKKGDGANGAEVQTSPEKPIARRTRRRAAEEFTAGAVQGVEYAKRRKINPTQIVAKRTTRTASLAEETGAAAATGSTGGIEEERDDDDDMEPDLQRGGDNVYPSSSMPPPPVVLNPALAAARNMPTPRSPTPAAQLPSRTLAAREKLHALMRQRQVLSAGPSAAGAGVDVPKPAGVYQPTVGGLRVEVEVHRPVGIGARAASAGDGDGSGPNSNDYRTPMAGQTPIYSVHHAAAAGGGVGGKAGGAYGRPQQRQQQQQQAPALPGVGSAAGGTSDVWNGVLQQRQQHRQQQQQSAASGGAAKSTFSSLLGL
ncbi:hypothetical protein Ndes2526B_g06497 [Nannochloris sp. 'desiccata']